MLRPVPLLLVLIVFGGTVSPTWAQGEGGTVNAPDQVTIDWLDLTIIGTYLVGIVALGCLAGRGRKGAKGSDYFLASKSLSWPMIGMALFATNISTIHLVSFAQNGFTSGLTYGNFEWMAAFTLVMLALFFAPFYLRANVATLPDFMERRYSRGSRDYLAILSIFSAVVVHIGFSLHTGAIVLEGTILPNYGIENPEDYRLATVIAICGITALYTIVGGLLAVVLTETIQTVVMLIGSTAITIIGFQMIGGWQALEASVHPVNLTVLRPASDPTGISWYAVFLGYPVLGIWYWCTDQTIVQRVLGARDENHARVGPLFAGFIKILPVFIFVLPGIVCLALINTGKIPALPLRADGSPMTERTYTHMINTLLGSGMRGLVIAAMLAALMSTVSGALNSIATLVSYDIYRRFKPQADDRHLVWVGRVATFAAMCVAIAWTMAMKGMNETIFQAMVDVFPVMAPPTAVVFLWGVFWKGASARAALWTLIGGSLVGFVFYMLQLSWRHGVIELDASSLLAQTLAVNALFMSFILFVIESFFLIILSMIWPQRHTPESAALVWNSPGEALRRDARTWPGLLDFRVLAGLLVAAMVLLYVWFSWSKPYYPVGGTVTLAGQPIVGARVILDTDDDRFDATLLTGIDGKYQYATKERAGGAPAGTVYRVRLEPARDFLVELRAARGRTQPVLLASLPPGSEAQEVQREGKRYFVVRSIEGEQTVAVAPGADVEYWPASEVPPKYRDFASSGLTITVASGSNVADFRLDRERVAALRQE